MLALAGSRQGYIFLDVLAWPKSGCIDNKGKRIYTLAVRFEWDEDKHQANIVKHKADFADASEMFQGLMMVKSDLRNDYGEDRQVGYGFINNRVMVVVFTGTSARGH